MEYEPFIIKEHDAFQYRRNVFEIKIHERKKKQKMYVNQSCPNQQYLAKKTELIEIWLTTSSFTQFLRIHELIQLKNIFQLPVDFW